MLLRLAVCLLLPTASRTAWGPADDVGGIHRACESDDPAEVEAALAAGADVNLRGPGGQTPLFRSVLAGREKAVRTLLAHGADVSIPESSGFVRAAGTGRAPRRVKKARRFRLSACACACARRR